MRIYQGSPLLLHFALILPLLALFPFLLATVWAHGDHGHSHDHDHDHGHDHGHAVVEDTAPAAEEDAIDHPKVEAVFHLPENPFSSTSLNVPSHLTITHS